MGRIAADPYGEVLSELRDFHSGPHPEHEREGDSRKHPPARRKAKAAIGVRRRVAGESAMGESCIQTVSTHIQHLIVRLDATPFNEEIGFECETTMSGGLRFGEGRKVS
jgi:hypothetical protein